MDSPADFAIYKIERDIERNRDAMPCDMYERTAKDIPFCANCGWLHFDEEVYSK